jgi:large subunit ribosomal protein L9
VKYNNKKGEIMRVVFLQDVPNVAKAGEIKEVADGYGRNFLIPKKLALLAKPQAIKQVETGDIMKARVNAELTALASQLEGKEVTLKAKAGAKDRLYGSITSADIASELSKASGLDIDKRKVELGEPIRQLGSYEVTIRLAKDILPKIKDTVAEEETPKEEKKAPKAKRKAPKKEKKAPEEKVQEEKAPKKKRAPKKEEKTLEGEEKTPKKVKRTRKKEEKT